MEKTLQDELNEIIDKKDCPSDEKKFLREFSQYILKHRRIVLHSWRSDENLAVYGAYMGYKGIQVVSQEDGTSKLGLFVHKDYGEVVPDLYYNPETTEEFVPGHQENNAVTNESVLDLALAYRKTIEAKIERDENVR